jgi:CelD/BcsL family acetyltransferase involved in cellulose biosynthesis
VSRRGNFPEKYLSKQERAFHRELMDRMRDRRWIELAFLYLDGEAIAFEYGFNLNGRFEDWRTGFDLTHSDLAGGTLLINFLLQHLCNEKYSELDFLRGEYDFKEKWLPVGREFTELRIVQPHRISARLALIWLPDLWRRFKQRYKSKQKTKK